MTIGENMLLESAYTAPAASASAYTAPAASAAS
jgi:hypothetical protein